MLCIHLAGSRRAALAAGMVLLAVVLAAGPFAAQSSADNTPLMVRFSFVPNDPYFRANTPTSGFSGQWHLVNEIGGDIDANVIGAWNRGITGAGVTIGIVDDCLQIAHPDLSPNYDAADSWDFGQNDGDPSPVNPDDMHGTSVAGVAAAKGGNGIGVTGAAPSASIAGLRVDFDNQTAQQFINATLYHSSGSNTSIKIKNHSYGADEPYADSTSMNVALDISAAAGTIHVFAAGNSRGASNQDSGTMQLQASPSSITVAALGADGKFSYYSNFGACVFVTAPSSDLLSATRITTTDLLGSAGYNSDSADTFPDDNYTSRFGGTSSATPLVSGTIALAKEVQPALDVRFAKHLLALTSRVVDATDATGSSDGGWRTNAAGYHFNQNYGFGLIDADALTAAAVQYTGVTPQTSETTGPISVSELIPDNDDNGLTRMFSFDSTTPLEEVLVQLDITHTARGDLEAYLTSPSGYTSRLFMNAADAGADIDWTFTTNAFWGEDPDGTWSLMVRDISAGDVGTWNSFDATALMGELVPEPTTLCMLALGGLAVIRRRRVA